MNDTHTRQRTHGAKLTADGARAIYERAWAGESVRAIARSLGGAVSTRMIQYIKYGKAWRGATGAAESHGQARAAAIGRGGRGQRHGRAVFSAAQAAAIYERVWHGESLTSVALAYTELLGRPLSPRRIHSIKYGLTWGPITGHERLVKHGGTALVAAYSGKGEVMRKADVAEVAGVEPAAVLPATIAEVRAALADSVAPEVLAQIGLGNGKFWQTGDGDYWLDAAYFGPVARVADLVYTESLGMILGTRQNA